MFSLDSVITAAGMANELWVMITAVILAVIVMLIEFINIRISRNAERRSLAKEL